VKLTKNQRRNSFTITIDKPFMCEVPDAELVGPTAAGFDRDGNIIAETIVPLFSKTILKTMYLYEL